MAVKENDVQGTGDLGRETRRIAITRGELLSEHRDLEAAVKQCPGGRQANDATADDENMRCILPRSKEGLALEAEVEERRVGGHWACVNEVQAQNSNFDLLFVGLCVFEPVSVEEEEAGEDANWDVGLRLDYATFYTESY